jgi:hypothetical protein
VRAIHLSNTLEDTLEPIGFASDACTLDLRPFQIATLRILPAG